MTEFNPDDILNATVPTEELDGKKPRTPEGGYPNSVITDIKAFALSMEVSLYWFFGLLTVCTV